MPRSKRGKKRPNVYIEQLEKAVEDVVKCKVSFKDAAKKYNMKLGTVLCRLESKSSKIFVSKQCWTSTYDNIIYSFIRYAISLDNKMLFRSTSCVVQRYIRRSIRCTSEWFLFFFSTTFFRTSTEKKLKFLYQKLCASVSRFYWYK